MEFFSALKTNDRRFRMEVSKDIQEKVLEAIEIAKNTGKIKKGTNEVTKIVEKGLAKLAVIAKDVNPPEITMHMQPLCQEKKIPLVTVNSKEELGAAAGLGRSTASVAIIQEGEAKNLIKEVIESLK